MPSTFLSVLLALKVGEVSPIALDKLGVIIIATAATQLVVWAIRRTWRSMRDG